jgi:hypothetical protein
VWGTGVGADGGVSERAIDTAAQRMSKNVHVWSRRIGAGRGGEVKVVENATAHGSWCGAAVAVRSHSSLAEEQRLMTSHRSCLQTKAQHAGNRQHTAN